jgi:hypothetical protein
MKSRNGETRGIDPTIVGILESLRLEMSHKSE